ncbi:MAG: hypothetical protein J6P12_02035 [Methanobrevibacter sp.]|nr:hypothetical protein [Methanobrevibacter sp.]
MKLNFNLYISFVLIVSLVLMGGVAASDFNGADVGLLSTDCSFNHTEGVCDSELLSKTYSIDGGKFSDVQNVVDKAKSGDTIRLSGKFTASNGKSQIKIDKRLTITSASTATFDGKGVSGILNLKSDAKGTVISNLKFVNGYASVASAIYIDVKDITIKNCVFEDNRGSDNGGGAVATSWDQNTASGLTIRDSVFRRNVAPASSGAVAAFSTNFKIINCVFEDNAAFNNVGRTAYEGALQVGMSNTYGLVSGCTFKNNYVISDDKSKPSYGGATGIRTGTVMENCYFEGNHADKGGAIYFFSQGTVNNCKFVDNTATYGGAIYTDVIISNIQDCIFNDNSADYGGVIYATKGQLSVFNSNFDKCFGGNGGAVYSLNSELNIFNSNFTGNVADNGGAIHTNGEVNVFNSNFLDNGAGYGGAIFSNCEELEINNTIFKNNYALNGSAIYNNCILNIYESFFEDNKANSYNITSSNNAPVKKGEDLIITVKLLVGDNVVDAIYNQGNITIDDDMPKQSSLAINQEIVLILDNGTYIVKTNDEGIAEFTIDSSDLDIGNFTYFFMYIDSELYSGIDDNDTVEILENPAQKNVNSKNKNEDLLGSSDDNKISKSSKSKTKKYADLKDYLKSKGYSSFRDLIIDNSHKYSPYIDKDYNNLKEKYKDDKGIDDYL